MRAGLLATVALCAFAACGDGENEVSDASAPPLTVSDDSVGLTTTAFEDRSVPTSSSLLIRPIIQCTSSAYGPRDSITVSGQAYLPMEEVDSMVCLVGPAVADASVFQEATVAHLRSWSVDLPLRPGELGLDQFNEFYAECYDRTAACPTGQFAIALGDRILDNPTVSAPSLDGPLSISTPDEESAEALAAAINAALFE